MSAFRLTIAGATLLLSSCGLGDSAFERCMEDKEFQVEAGEDGWFNAAGDDDLGQAVQRCNEDLAR